MVFSLMTPAINPSAFGNPKITSTSILISSISLTRHLSGKLTIAQIFYLLHNILYFYALFWFDFDWLDEADEGGIYRRG